MRLAVTSVLALTACSFTGHGALDVVIDAPVIVDATDAPIDAPSGPCTTWCRRKPITIPAAKVRGGPHTNFPALIRIASDAELVAEARADGFDLRFTTADGTPLPYERMRFNATTGQLEAWVRIPLVSSSADTVIYLNFANPDATDQQAASAVWAPSYRGVWHLEQTTGGANAILDSSGNANHGTDRNGVTFGATGQIGKAVAFDGVNDVIEMADSTSLDATATEGSIAAWLYWTDTTVGHQQVVMSSSNRFNSNPDDGFEWASQSDGDHYFYPWGGDGTNYNLGPSPYANQTWQYGVVTFNSATKTVAIYVNGVAMTFVDTNVPAHWTQIASPGSWLWGDNPLGSQVAFGGMMDELRVASVAHDAGWIGTEYSNQSAPATFSVVGPVETLP